MRPGGDKLYRKDLEDSLDLSLLVTNLHQVVLKREDKLIITLSAPCPPVYNLISEYPAIVIIRPHAEEDIQEKNISI